MPKNELISSNNTPRNLLTSNSVSDLERAVSGRCDKARLFQNLDALMKNYFIPNETKEELLRHLAIMVEDLARFSQEVVDRVIPEWRRTMTRRPSSADLVQRCQDFEFALMRRRDGLAPEDAPQDTPRENKPLEERIAAVASAFKRGGYEQDREGRWELPATKLEKPKVPHWSTTPAASNPRFVETLKIARANNALASPPPYSDDAWAGEEAPE